MQAYIPAVVAVAMAFIVIAWPWLAAFLVAGALISFAMFYAAVVYRFRQLRKMADANQAANMPGFERWEEPTFRNVTVFIRERPGQIFRF